MSDHVPDDKHAAFHREVGELVFWFATAENAVYAIALELLGGPKRAKAVLAGVHLDRAVQLVRSLAAEFYGSSPRVAELDKALLAFKKCAEERNRLLHSVSLPSDVPEAGSEVIRLLSMRTLQRAWRERKHVRQLQE